MWRIDLRDWLDESRYGPSKSMLKLKVKKLKEIVVYATSAKADRPAAESPECWRELEDKPCNGTLDIHLDGAGDQIYWKCHQCQDEGVVSGWQGLVWDDFLHSERAP